MANPGVAPTTAARTGAHAAPVLSLAGITKRFGRNQVLSAVSMDFHAGDFIGLMGPNGAGKSTLIKVLDGIYAPGGGVIEIEGQRVKSLAGDSRVAFIHQDLGVVPDLSVNENLWLGRGREGGAGRLLLSRRSEVARSKIALRQVGLDVDPMRRLGTLSAGEQTLVAIARALDQGARVIFMDEATSTLPLPEARRVLQSLRVAAESGACIVIVSHKLSEILEYCERVVVLLDGAVSVDEPIGSLDRDGLVRMLAAQEHQDVPDSPDRRIGDRVLRVDGAVTESVGPVSLAVRRGEVLGITGVPGSGLHDLGYLLAGRARARRGTIERAPGLRTAFMPPRRESQGGFAEMSVASNLTLSSLKRWRRTSTRLIAAGDEIRSATEMSERLAVKPSGVSTRYGVLSGGNKQKVIFGRLLFMAPDLYVLCEPTRGVDVTARREIYSLIRQVVTDGAAVVIVTSDAEDILSVCDSASVVREGKLDRFVPVEALGKADLEKLL